MASSATPAPGGTTTVATSEPLCTKAWPVRGKPSTPRKGSFDQGPFGSVGLASSKAFLAPRAMKSFCAATAQIGCCCDVLKRNQDDTAWYPASSVQLALLMVLRMRLGDFAASRPMSRCCAAVLFAGP